MTTHYDQREDLYNETLQKRESNMIISQKRESDMKISEEQKQRLIDECNQVNNRLSKLSYFIDFGNTFDSLNDEMQFLLRLQCFVMTQYLDILKRRMTLLGIKE